MILIKNVDILNSDGIFTPSQNVIIDGSTINEITANTPEGAFDREIDGKGKILMPGFTNTHAHSPMCLMRGYGENLKLNEWLNKRIFPFEDRLTSEAVYSATMLAMAESFRFGIVSTTDMYYFCEDMVNAALDSGAKMNISRSLTSFDENEDVLTMKSYLEGESLYNGYNGEGDGRIIVDFSLHAEYTSTPRLVRALAALAHQNNVNIHVHVSETQEEHEGCKARHDGLTPTAYLNSLGLFDTKTTAAHCVWVEDADMDIFKEKGVNVASCPVSNLKLASGICNVPKLMEKGVSVSLGTDSVASNNSLNFIEEMKVFALVNKERRSDPTSITPAEAIAAATITGAISQGRMDCGKIEKGYKADIILIDATAPHMYPMHEAANNVVYSASGSDVCMTMVDGKVVYDNGEFLTIDTEKIKADVVKHAMAISGALNG